MVQPPPQQHNHHQGNPTMTTTTQPTPWQYNWRNNAPHNVTTMTTPYQTTRPLDIKTPGERTNPMTANWAPQPPNEGDDNNEEDRERGDKEDREKDDKEDREKDDEEDREKDEDREEGEDKGGQRPAEVHNGAEPGGTFNIFS